ncbi:hypothetical protein HPB47_005253 [Ixodes persulcatus]|uniref:Uncharacterized protein n=1 Tax=Ixodes persulcatus TaxID=34615 RepID=A0AC60PE70_IXOPE|nr:hypothetical protein HPB47_005253 [Ixodes persulcatus]
MVGALPFFFRPVKGAGSAPRQIAYIRSGGHSVTPRNWLCAPARFCFLQSASQMVPRLPADFLIRTLDAYARCYARDRASGASACSWSNNVRLEEAKVAVLMELHRSPGSKLGQWVNV